MRSIRLYNSKSELLFALPGTLPADTLRLFVKQPSTASMAPSQKSSRHSGKAAEQTVFFSGAGLSRVAASEVAEVLVLPAELPAPILTATAGSAAMTAKRQSSAAIFTFKFNTPSICIEKNANDPSNCRYFFLTLSHVCLKIVYVRKLVNITLV